MQPGQCYIIDNCRLKYSAWRLSVRNWRLIKRKKKGKPTYVCIYLYKPNGKKWEKYKEKENKIPKISLALKPPWICSRASSIASCSSSTLVRPQKPNTRRTLSTLMFVYFFRFLFHFFVFRFVVSFELRKVFSKDRFMIAFFRFSSHLICCFIFM